MWLRLGLQYLLPLPAGGSSCLPDPSSPPRLKAYYSLRTLSSNPSGPKQGGRTPPGYQHWVPNMDKGDGVERRGGAVYMSGRAGKDFHLKLRILG